MRPFLQAPLDHLSIIQDYSPFLPNHAQKVAVCIHQLDFSLRHPQIESTSFLPILPNFHFYATTRNFGKSRIVLN